MTIPFTDLKTQYQAIQPQVVERIMRVLDHGQYIMGPEVQELEERLAAFTGSKYCIAVASGTEALLISLMALGIGPGDEVITTPFTFGATAEVIVRLGAMPVFVDIEIDTGNIDPLKIHEKISRKTRAIMPVSLFGQPANMDEINAIAAKFGEIPVIEDGAQSFGAIYRGKRSCNLSTIGCTSFFPSKPLGCYGDGGAIFTSDDQLARACKEIRVHGQSSRYVYTRIGVGGRMDTLQCAILLAKFDRFQEELDRRIEIGKRYNSLLSGKLSLISQRTDRSGVFAQYTVLIENRDSAVDFLKQSGIPTAIHYPSPLNEQLAYNHLCCKDCTPNASKLSKLVLSLPMSADLSPQHQQLIASELLSFASISDC